MHKLDQTCGIRTLAVHAGEEPDAATGASAPNIVMSTLYRLARRLLLGGGTRRGDSIHLHPLG